ncbi:hypothetical protein LTR62_000590 [Meristemomyces frigidus]|uniref:Hamartin n=1 Tax=Meristemomyces frigidus TaxID=1508187 RepID=A0AAN7T8S4_9PEZI|nr:hypothetical protein LTR62_000590 [Meristemomyces frigidus]
MPTSQPEAQPHIQYYPYADFHRTMKDAIKALQTQFTAAKIPLSLPLETRRVLQNFVDQHNGTISEEESAKVNTDLKNFWEHHVGESPAKTGAFVGVLKELQPALVRDEAIFGWWGQVIRPVITSTAYRKVVLDDAVDFIVRSLSPEEGTAIGSRQKVANRLLADMFSIYATQTRSLVGEDHFVAAGNAQISQQVEVVLVAYGRKQPKELFGFLDKLISGSESRLQGLALLGIFLRQQTPHLYLAAETPLVETLLKCLMNDTSVTVLSVALTSLVMLLPNLPSARSTHLPRLFLVYSRLLCWEKFSPLSNEVQKDAVTDDKITMPRDHGDVGIDPEWEKARPSEALPDGETPELLTYFTYLYGLYPLNFASYIREPRQYLKDKRFPGADDFDLDQSVIRSRTDQYRQLHLMHPNFYSLSIAEELDDAKWSSMEAADVVAEVHALCMANAAPVSPGPPPSTKLPNVPRLPVITTLRSPQISPSTSHASFRTGNSWRDTSVSGQTMDGDSPVLGPQGIQSDDEASVPALRPRSKGTNGTAPSLDDFPRPGKSTLTRSPKAGAPQSNLAFIERENTLLRNELNFERWHKAQYSAHIGQLMRKNVKDAAADAEHLNLINANRAMKKQLDHIRGEQQATVKDSSVIRKHSNNLEASFSERFAQMRKEQESWRADTQELHRLRQEVEQYRELLVATEAREANQKNKLEMVKRDLGRMEDVQQKLDNAEDKLREYEYREFDMDRAKHELEIVLSEKETLQMRMRRHQHDLERARHAHTEKVAELQACLDAQSTTPRAVPSHTPGRETQVLIQQAVAETLAKHNQLRKKHLDLQEKYTDLELEHESVKAQLDAMQGRTGRNGTYFLQDADNESYSLSSRDMSMAGGMTLADHGFDTASELLPISENAYVASASDPTNRRHQSRLTSLPVSPPASDATLHKTAGLTWKPPISRQDSIASKSSGAPAFTFNQTAPLKQDESKSAFSDGSGDSTHKKDKAVLEKIKPNSEVRVYGRGELLFFNGRTTSHHPLPLPTPNTNHPTLEGGAQNIKLKASKDDKEKPEKRTGFGGRLKNLV